MAAPEESETSRSVLVPPMRTAIFKSEPPGICFLPDSRVYGNGVAFADADGFVYKHSIWSLMNRVKSEGE